MSRRLPRSGVVEVNCEVDRRRICSSLNAGVFGSTGAVVVDVLELDELELELDEELELELDDDELELEELDDDELELELDELVEDPAGNTVIVKYCTAARYAPLSA